MISTNATSNVGKVGLFILDGFGIGGLHYANNFNKRILDSDIAIGHICPKYALENLDKEMILQGMSKTVPKADFVLLDWVLP